MNYIVQDNHPDVGFSIEVGAVLDAEGHPIADAELVVTAVSSDDSVLGITFDADTRAGNATFGAPGTAAFTVQVSDTNGTLLGSGGDNFTVTTGDPASIAGITATFDGLTPTP